MQVEPPLDQGKGKAVLSRKEIDLSPLNSLRMATLNQQRSKKYVNSHSPRSPTQRHFKQSFGTSRNSRTLALKQQLSTSKALPVDIQATLKKNGIFISDAGQRNKKVATLQIPYLNTDSQFI